MKRQQGAATSRVQKGDDVTLALAKESRALQVSQPLAEKRSTHEQPQIQGFPLVGPRTVPQHPHTPGSALRTPGTPTQRVAPAAPRGTAASRGHQRQPRCQKRAPLAPRLHFGPITNFRESPRCRSDEMAYLSSAAYLNGVYRAAEGAGEDTKLPSVALLPWSATFPILPSNLHFLLFQRLP